MQWQLKCKWWVYFFSFLFFFSSLAWKASRINSKPFSLIFVCLFFFLSRSVRYNQHLSPISRPANPQVDHHRHTTHVITSHQHLHPLQSQFETNDVNKISQSNSNCGGSDTDLTAIDDESNVLNLSRRRSSDTINSNINNNNNNNSISSNNSNTGEFESAICCESENKNAVKTLTLIDLICMCCSQVIIKVKMAVRLHHVAFMWV